MTYIELKPMLGKGEINAIKMRQFKKKKSSPLQKVHSISSEYNKFIISNIRTLCTFIVKLKGGGNQKLVPENIFDLH